MQHPSNRRPTSLAVLLLIYAAFVSLGLPDGILGAAWPPMRTEFGVRLNDNWPMLALGMTGGMLSSFLSGWLLRRLGVGRVLVLTTFLTGAVILGIGLSPRFAVVVGLSFLLGAGNGAVDAGLNYYVASGLSSRHMNWLHGFWGVGASLGTLIVTTSFALDGTWRTAYCLIAPLQATLGVAFLFHGSAFQGSPTPAQHAPPPDHPPFLSTFTLPAAWASMALFFCYCGVEFGTGMWIASLLHDGRGWPMESAGLMVSLYWGSLTTGRFLIGTVSQRTTPLSIVRVAALGSVVGTGLMALSSLMTGRPGLAGGVTGLGLLVTGLSLSPIFPMLMHDTPRCVGAGHAMNLIGIQAGLANLGLTVLPIILGSLMRFGSTEWLGGLLLLLASTLPTLLVIRERHVQAARPHTARPT